jgi:butyrate kinase
LVHNEYVVEQITEMVKFIGPVKAYPGEFEMEAMGVAAFAVLTGAEPAKVYKVKK